jgi:hypothetical protein
MAKRRKTDKVVQKLIQCLENGLARTSACAVAKVARRTFYEWLSDENFRSIIEDAEETRLAYVENKKKQLIDKNYRPAVENELKAKRRDTYGDKLGIDDGKG